jgi:tetratricopeptide (TPR) repeat protein
VRRKLLGDKHPDVALSLSNLANALDGQGKHVEAEELHRQDLALSRELLGDEHPHTGTSYGNLAICLHNQRRYADADPSYRRALAIREKVFGKDHPQTALSCNNLAINLRAQGKHAEAEQLLRRALAIRKGAGNSHPDTTTTLVNLGHNLHAQGRYPEALEAWRTAGQSFESARLRVAGAGLSRAAFADHSPYGALAAALARAGQANEAWEALESEFGRSLLEEFASRGYPLLSPEERQQQQVLNEQLDQIAPQVLALVTKQQPTAKEQARLKELTRKRVALESELASLAVMVARRDILELKRLQAQLPADAALLAWVDIYFRTGTADPNGEHWGCVVRRSGPPAWVKLPGSGPAKAWIEDDHDLHHAVRDLLIQPPRGATSDWPALLGRLHAQRLAPLEPYLQAQGELPAVRRLIVLPAGRMARIPLEVLSSKYLVSYAPSGTLFARLRERRPQQSSAAPALLALGISEFKRPAAVAKPAAPPPEKGVYVSHVLPGSNAAKTGLRTGDVLLRLGDRELTQAADLEGIPDKDALAVHLWRDGQTLTLTLPHGPLGVEPSRFAVAEAVQLRRDGELAVQRSQRGPAYAPLPGARREVQTVARLFPQAEVLLDAQATKPRLQALAKSDRLRAFPVVHLATHGVIDRQRFRRSALILAQDGSSDPPGPGRTDGQVTVEEILETWRLDAELVTLSACETGLGKDEGGEGFLGFVQALLMAGARSLMVSLWPVDDTATALLMERFYQNLLGKRAGLTKPLPKAEALHEAKQWLRCLPADEAEKLGAALPGGKRVGKTAVPPDAALKAGRPYEHPYYWAAFILIGDSD